MIQRFVLTTGLLVAVVAAALGGISLVAPSAVAPFWSVIGSSGNSSSSPNFSIGSTSGQGGPIGESSSTNFGVGWGFWQGVVQREADVRLAKRDAADPVPSAVSEGPLIDYTLDVTNAGTVDAQDVVVTDILPASATFISSMPGAPTCTESAGTLTCNLGTLAGGASTTIDVTVRGPLVSSPPVVITNSACVVASNEPGGLTADNCDSEDTCIDAAVEDSDGDGYTDCVEAYLGTDPLDRCTPPVDSTIPPSIPSLAWPADLDTRLGVLPSFARINILDITSFIVPLRYLDTDTGANPGAVRWDLVPGDPGGILGTEINIQDMTALIVGPNAFPPMPPFNGTLRVFDGPACQEA